MRDRATVTHAIRPGQSARVTSALNRHDRDGKRIRQQGTRSRLSESLFRGFVVELLAHLRSEGLGGLPDCDLLTELVVYLKHGGKCLRVRMPSGRLQVHRAFDCSKPLSSYPTIEPEQPDDVILPVYSCSDFSYLDGLARDMREKADELGLEWSIAVSICEELRDETHFASSSPDQVVISMDKPVLTLKETCRLLGISRSSVYRLLDEGKLVRPDLGKKPRKRGKVLVLTESVKALLQESAE